MNKLEFMELNAQELEVVNGGKVPMLTALAAVAGIVYLAGEIAESAGRQYRKNYLE